MRRLSVGEGVTGVIEVGEVGAEEAGVEAAELAAMATAKAEDMSRSPGSSIEPQFRPIGCGGCEWLDFISSKSPRASFSCPSNAMLQEISQK